MKKTMAAGLMTALLTGALVVGAASGAQAATTKAKTAKVTFTIAGAHSLISGDVASITVKATKKAKNAKVLVQKQSDESAWKTVSKLKLNKKGAVTAKLTVSGAGTINYRAVVKKTKTVKKSTSKSVVLEQQAWYPLSELSPVISTPGLLSGGSQEIAGVTYDDSLTLPIDVTDGGSATYNLAYKCSSFSAHTGLSDLSTFPGTLSTNVSVDGKSLASGSTTVGHATAYSVDTTGGFRLTLNGTVAGVTDATQTVDSVWGDAEVLCSARP